MRKITANISDLQNTLNRCREMAHEDRGDARIAISENGEIYRATGEDRGDEMWFVYLGSLEYDFATCDSFTRHEATHFSDVIDTWIAEDEDTDFILEWI